MRDRFPLVLAAGIVCLGGLALIASQTASQAPFADAHSTHLAGSAGARALYLLAKRLQLAVHRNTTDLRHVPAKASLLLLGIGAPLDANPGDLADAEITAILKHIHAGHTLVYAPIPEPTDRMLEKLEVRWITARDPTAQRISVPALPSAYTSGIEQVEAPVAGTLDLAGVGVPLLMDALTGEVTAAWVPYGEGQILIVAGPDSATNAWIGKADNARFWSNLLWSATRGGPLLVDEHHHGFAASRSILPIVYKYRMQWPLLQCGLAVLVWVLSTRRLGPAPAELPRAEPRQQPGLFSASVYRLGKHHRHAAKVIHDALEQELVLKFHVSQDAPGTVGNVLALHLPASMKEDLSDLRQLSLKASRATDVHDAATIAARVREHLSKPSPILHPTPAQSAQS